MVLFLDRFSEQYSSHGKRVKKYDSAEKYVHDMTIDEIMDCYKNLSVQTMRVYVHALEKYFIWLQQQPDFTEKEKLRELFFQVRSIRFDSATVHKNSKHIFTTLYHTFSEILDGLKVYLKERYPDMEDYEKKLGFCTTFFWLAWNGVSKEEMGNIKDTDVNTGSIYIRDTDTYINLSDEVRDIILRYNEMTVNYMNNRKYLEGYLFKIVAVSKDAVVNNRTIQNLYQNIFNGNVNKREFGYKNIAKSGLFREIYEIEKTKEKELTFKEFKEICPINHFIMKTTNNTNQYKFYEEYSYWKSGLKD